MNIDDKQGLIAKAIGTQRGKLMLADAMTRPIFRVNVGSALDKCMTCGRTNEEDGCDGIGKFPKCWRPEGTLVLRDYENLSIL